MASTPLAASNSVVNQRTVSLCSECITHLISISNNLCAIFFNLFFVVASNRLMFSKLRHEFFFVKMCFFVLTYIHI